MRIIGNLVSFSFVRSGCKQQTPTIQRLRQKLYNCVDNSKRYQIPIKVWVKKATKLKLVPDILLKDLGQTHIENGIEIRM